MALDGRLTLGAASRLAVAWMATRRFDVSYLRADSPALTSARKASDTSHGRGHQTAYGSDLGTGLIWNVSIILTRNPAQIGSSWRLG